MSKLVYIDVDTGEARLSLESATTRRRLKFYLRDKTPISLIFVRGGQNITADILEDEAAELKVGIRANPGDSVVMAFTSDYEITDGEARLILSLNTVPLVDFFDALPISEIESEFTIEVEVTSADETARVTHYQAPCVVGREVCMENDLPPEEPVLPRATWGYIDGDITDQEDLQLALAAKLSVVAPPATPTSPGVHPSMAIGLPYIYFTVANNDWRRVALTKYTT